VASDSNLTISAEGSERPKGQSFHSPPSSAEVKNSWSFTPLHVMCDAKAQRTALKLRLWSSGYNFKTHVTI